MDMKDVFELFKAEFPDCRVDARGDCVVVSKMGIYCPTLVLPAATEPDRAPELIMVRVSYAIAWPKAEIVAKTGNYLEIREEIDRRLEEEIAKVAARYSDRAAGGSIGRRLKING